ncbi:hypothetical protein LLS1_05010 [Leifsonia sp. LS1]|nr:hypothetical protein LLS1_05010 [Leifsonia sp. LS1]
MKPPVANTGLAGGVALGLLRSVLLWVVVPVAFLLWLVLLLWLWAKVPLRGWIRWVDYNMIVTLCRTVLSPLMREPTLKWLPPKYINEIDTRVGYWDFF